MTRKPFFHVLVAVAIVALLVPLAGTGGATAQPPVPSIPAAPEAPMGTAFTYQGELTDGGSPANGSYDFRFRLYDAVNGGNQVGGSVAVEDASVVDGQFSVRLDFGGGIFRGEARWLEVGVRPGDSTDPYTVLEPRQALTPTPYALYAASIPAHGHPHDHLGETWTGNDNPLAITGAFGEPDDASLLLSNSHTAGHGLKVLSAGLTGVYVEHAGGDGVAVGSADGFGLRVGSVGGHGVYVQSAANDGMYVGSAGYNGLRVDAAVLDGVHIGSAGGYAGYFGGDIYVGGTCYGCTLATFGVNTSDRPLEPGDIVSVRGVRPSELNGIPMLMEVSAALNGEAPFGVVQGLVEQTSQDDSSLDETGRYFVPREGPAPPGGYVAIVTYGAVQVKASAVSSPIAAGTRLAVDSEAQARALRTVKVDGIEVAENIPTIGIALEALGSDGLIWVLVNPQ